MKAERKIVNGIPAIVWGEPSDKVYIFVHGKMSNKEAANAFAEIACKKGFQTISFDLPEHGERAGSRERCDIWNGIHDLDIIAEYCFRVWNQVSLYACSLGAYFSLNAYGSRPFHSCLFLSPIVNMEHLIRQMLIWFNVEEEQLEREGEIFTPVDPLRWDYFQYVLAHPILKWDIPTAILYGGKDTLQSREVIERFAKAFNCKLLVSEQSEHPFMAEKDAPIIRKWLEEAI